MVLCFVRGANYGYIFKQVLIFERYIHKYIMSGVYFKNNAVVGRG